MQTLKIDLVSDVVCPWCAIGDARLQQAIALVGDELGSVVAVDPPPADEVVVLSDLADLPTVMDACGQQDPVGA